MSSTLKNHPIWHNLTQTLRQLDPNQIALQHLQACNAQINGYWDEDEFYEVVTFTQFPSPELISSSLGVTPQNAESAHWLKLNFLLTATNNIDLKLPNSNRKTPLGELVLILDENLEVIDEDWLIDVDSPYVLAQSSTSSV